MPDFTTWHAHGKLLLTGEYLVLEGAKALAIPINKGQSLKVREKAVADDPVLEWKAFKPGGFWFGASFKLPDLSLLETSDTDLASNLQKLLSACQKMSGGFLEGSHSFLAETNLEFNSAYGFGSSSTLVSNLAYWANIDPFVLQRTVLGGSGYDIACARSKKPLFYQLVDEKPFSEKVTISYPFAERLYFVYLGHKQRTTDSIKVFKQKARFGKLEKEQISKITENVAKVQKLNEFERLLEEHEKIMSSVLGLKPVKQQFFPDHQGIVKSLGAWGGDFVLMTSGLPRMQFKNYLHQKGFDIFYSWDELVLK